MELTDTNVSRRDFLHKAACSVFILAGMGITVTSCAGGDVAGPEGPGGGGGGTNGITVNGNVITVDLSVSGPNVLNSAGGFLLISIGGAMAVNAGGTIRAFTNVCTHEQCTTSWSYGNSRLTCGCHGSQFNNSGQVVVGPATSPLREFSVSRSGDIVTINKT